jgi:hypothetical protein
MLSDPSYRLVFDATQKYGDRTVFAIGFALAVLAACLVGGMLVVHAVRRGHHRRLLSALGVASILLVLLEYSHWMTTQGFSQDITVGGPMRSGLHVRIHYVRFGTPPYENVIVRIELRE